MTPSWTHPTLGAIEPLPRGLQPAKVWKHFYDTSEHWERLSGSDVSAMRRQAEQVIGVARDGHPELPRLDSVRRLRVAELSAIHHDEAYGPLYMAGLAAGDARWTEAPDAEGRHKVLTPQAVFVVVRCEGWNRVVTAFRPLPALHGVHWDEAAIRRYAIEYYGRQAAMHADHLARTTIESLRQVAVAVPRSVNDLWWLASAIGYGRLLTHHAGVADILPAAEAVLAATSPELVADFARALDWEGCLHRLAAGLKDEGPEETEAVLGTAETLLAVADVVGAGTEAGGFCAEAEGLLAWIPAAWEHLGGLAAARQEMLGAPEHPVARWWSMVEDAAVAAMMRELVPAAPAAPTAALVGAAVVSVRARWQPWVHRLAQVTQAPSRLVEWVANSLSSVRAEHPIPVMGQTGAAEGALDVRGRPAPAVPSFRLFVIDNDHRDGFEVTEHFGIGDEPLWHMDPHDQDALLVLIASATPVRGDDLAAVLVEAEDRNDVAVGAKEISRPK